MADTPISLAQLTEPVGGDLVPLARVGDEVARVTSVESIINSQVGGDASSNTPNQDTLGVAIGLNNDAEWGGVAIGMNNSAAGTGYQAGAVAIGEGNAVDIGHAFGRSNVVTADGFIFGDSCSVGGDESVALGYRNTITHEQAFIIGHEGVSRLYREHIEAFGSAYAYIVKHLLSKTTTNATPAVMGLTGGEAFKMTIKQDAIVAFTVRITASTQDAAISAVWVLTGAIKNAGGVVSLLGSIVTTFSGADAGASTWQVAVTANDGEDCLEITVTGQAGTTIQWYALVEGLEQWFT